MSGLSVVLYLVPKIGQLLGSGNSAVRKVLDLNGPLFAATSASASWNTHLLRMDTSRIHPGLVGPQVSATIRGVTNRVMNSWLQIYDLQTLSWLFAQTSWGHMINEDFWSHPHFRTDQNPSLLVAWNSSPLVAMKKKKHRACLVGAIEFGEGKTTPDLSHRPFSFHKMAIWWWLDSDKSNLMVMFLWSSNFMVICLLNEIVIIYILYYWY